MENGHKKENKMKIRKTVVLLAGTLALLFGAAFAAHGQSFAIVTQNNNCLIPGSDRAIYVMKCSGNTPVRYRISDGRISTSDNYCFDHGVSKGTRSVAPYNYVKLVGCHNGKSQQWNVATDNRNTGIFQNALNTDVCLNIEGGNDSPGGRVIVWQCGWYSGVNPSGPSRNERFLIGTTWRGPTGTSLLAMGPSVQEAINAAKGGGAATLSNNVRLIGNDGSTMVAAGAGNMVAAGAGNMVAAGGGNILTMDPSKLISNLVGNDGASLRSLSVSSLTRP